MELEEARESFDSAVTRLKEVLEQERSVGKYQAATMVLSMLALYSGAGPVPVPPTTNTFPCPHCKVNISYY